MRCSCTIVLSQHVGQRTPDPAREYDQPAGTIISDIVEVDRPGEPQRYGPTTKWTFITTGGADEFLVYRAHQVALAVVEDSPAFRVHFSDAPFPVDFIFPGARLCERSGKPHRSGAEAGRLNARSPSLTGRCPACDAVVLVLGQNVPPHVPGGCSAAAREPISERRDDGWPLCPKCGNDELSNHNAPSELDGGPLFCLACHWSGYVELSGLLAKARSTAQWEHPACSGCVFLGRNMASDLYFCRQPGLQGRPTVIERYASARLGPGVAPGGHPRTSPGACAGFLLAGPEVHSLWVARERAVRGGLISGVELEAVMLGKWTPECRFQADTAKPYSPTI